MSTGPIHNIVLERVHYIPRDLDPGILYVSEEFGAAAHLCACGCGSKVRTPLGPTEWSFIEVAGLPSLSPSIGRWQSICKSHYWIESGRILWARPWSKEEVALGRAEEERRRRDYEREIAARVNLPSRWRLWKRILKVLATVINHR